MSVPIRWQIGPEFLPEAWRPDPYAAKATSLPDREAWRLCRLLARELAKYPPGFPAQELEGIHLSRTLEIFGQLYGASYQDRSLYLTSTGAADGFTDRYVARTLHHELSSVLMQAHEFDSEAWQRAAPPGFRYASTFMRESALDDAWSPEGTPDLYRQGVLGAYGRENLENDVNLYAEILFAEPELASRLAAEYPVIQSKLAMLRAFYESIDARFRELWPTLAPPR